MSQQRNILTNPCWRAEDLGTALPDSEHAVSVALPTWADCVGYEEGDPRVINALQAGYPRFVTHPVVQACQRALAQQQGLDMDGMTLAPSPYAAHVAANYVRAHGHAVSVRDAGAAHVQILLHDPAARPLLRQAWQHCGILPSSRQCQAVLDGVPDQPALAKEAVAQVRALLASWYACDPQRIWLGASGMASIAHVLRALGHLKPGCPTLQLGFPYVDLLKVQQRFGCDVTFISGTDQQALDQVSLALQQRSYAAVFVEVPGNPLLTTPDIVQLAQICRQAGVPLVVDDTVASPLNVDVLSHATVVVDSLTKYVVGRGDVMAGAAVVNPQAPQARALAAAMQAEDDPEALWWQDAAALAERAQEYPQRIARINANAAVLVQRLRRHPAVADLYYPDQCANYRRLLRPQGGFGGLCSLVLHDGARWAPQVYDGMQVNKGPSLGTDFTLACPFTLLAHYRELEWAESCGVSRWLIRLAIGIEDPELLWQRVLAGLEQVQGT
ncbi:MAG: PLP-dependent transferase [Planctomycetota bacterium]|nr:MAG: PLP-dependent transferase [Planctomycetota bacterium]